jgi:hypothetical protein
VDAETGHAFDERNERWEVLASLVPAGGVKAQHWG